MKKRLLSLALVLCMVFTLLPVSAFAETYPIKGTCGDQGDNLTWVLDHTGTLTISGEGKMSDYSGKYVNGNFVCDAPWYSHGSAIKNVVINAGVMSIGSYAFAHCGSLTSITIPDSIKSIGEEAFQFCSLTDVSIPNSVTSIEKEAFLYCSSLTSITIPDGVSYIGEGVFYGCTSLESINVLTDNESYSSLDGVLFSKDMHTLVACPGAMSGVYTIPECVTNIDSYAFVLCTKLTGIKIPNSVTSIGAYAFALCGNTLANVYITDLAKWCDISFGNGSANPFYYGGNLYLNDELVTELVIPAGVTSIKNRAFGRSKSLTKVTIPTGVTSIGEWAFEYCSSLESVTIPDSVTSIGACAFSNCSSLTSAKFEGNAPTAFGTSVFDRCAYGFKIIAPANNTTWTDSEAYNAEAQTWNGYPIEFYSVGPKIIASGTCGEDLTWILYENGLLTINGEGDMYDCNNYAQPWYDRNDAIYKVVVCPGVTKIGAYAFSDCVSLTSVEIPADVTRIGTRAFDSCYSLENIVVSKDNKNYTSYDGVLFSKDMKTLVTCPGGKSGAYIIPDTVTNIVGWAFQGCVNLTSIEIPDGVTSIGSWAFRNCSSLVSISIPESVTSIEGMAFHNCYSLSDVYYSGTQKQWNAVSVDPMNTELSNAAIHFKHEHSYTSSETTPATCTAEGLMTYTCDCGDSYTEVIPVSGHNVVDGICTLCKLYGTCGDNLTWTLTDDGTLTISGTGAMNDYSHKPYNGTLVTSAPWGDNPYSIKKVVINSGVTSVGDESFFGCDRLTSVEIPDSVTSIGNYTFNCCTNLASIVIPDSVMSIGDFAFQACTSLTSVEIPDGVTSIGNGVFNLCLRLTSVTIGDGVTSIGNSVFITCSKLKSINVSSNNTKYSSSNGVLFNKNMTELICYPAGKTDTSYSIPDRVICIGSCAFHGCGNLTSVEIPDGVTRINEYAFYRCSSLTSMNIPDSVTSIGDRAFEWCDSLTSINIPDTVASIGEFAFSNCSSLTSITIPYNVPNIEYYAFNGCSSLTSINIPDSVTSIESFAFYACYDLTDVYYAGTQEQWNAVSISSNNECLTNATIHFHEHSYTSEVTTPATCTEEGLMTYTCECGDSYTEVIKAFGHDYDEWTITTAPTCTEQGVESRYCSRCDAAETRDVDALGHALVHHDGKAATCTEIGWKAYDTCSRCDYTTYKEIPAAGHNYTAVVTAPTCAEKGYTTYTCNVCGDSYIGSYVDALGHDFGEWMVTIPATCTESGDETRYCSRCDEFETKTVDATGHHYSEVVTAPTCTEDGYTTYTCACGDSYVADYTDALGHHYVGGVCTECGDTILVPALNIIQPSRTNIEYGETLVIRANVDNAPEGAKVIWSFEGNGAGYEVSPDGMTCYISCVDSGSVKVTATLVDENGNVITVDGSAVSDNISVSLKGGFLYKIISWFKDIFKIDRRVMSLFADYKYVY